MLKGSPLRYGKTLSCGCLAKEILSRRVRKHGGTGTLLYGTWKRMKTRCYSPSSRSYADYGGRGITMCDEWRHSFSNFAEWAHAHGYKEGLSIERIDVNGDYSPQNCTFIPMSEQPANRRSTLLTIGGVTKTKQEWAAENNMRLTTLSSRLNKLGWDPYDAVFTPVRGHK